MISKNLGRPKKTIPESYENVILKKYERYRLNALYLEKVIYAEDRVRIPHNTIHNVLKKYGFAGGKQVSRKEEKSGPMYERKQSLTARAYGLA
ncbi:MAG: hypothetical protein LAKADJCE_00648 [Candidatus Argoarchaeum ethanivorans]|uniref:Transposase n=1 Tax=Candidatus Argoarchaeum ethanivorans TaxID=2608793 RepID=A0A811T6S0_9EURY|nr:MAG: hypothetical protein LAKADJCE_00136 [Candidatus Argoarchaeum ethanivorans]CAD6494107.1 MAG: hypothetical protein LAKADJCE_00648 [Candidatus Argoarchaeum ethanivorans]